MLGAVASPVIRSRLRAMNCRPPGFLIALLSLAFGSTPAVAAQDDRPLEKRVEETLRATGAGTRFGLVVTSDDGREIIAINPDGRFIPASNTKMFTTAAAFTTLADLDKPDETGGASVRLEGKNVILKGGGDARLSSVPDCVADCLATLADAVAANVRMVRDVIGDDSLFPDERWSPGMSWNNIPTRSGTGISALTLDDNELPMTVTPAKPGQPPTVDLISYYAVDNRAVTVAGGDTELNFDRAPNGTILRLTGTIAVGSPPQHLRLGIDDPAYYAAWIFKRMLAARGVRVTGTIHVRHRPLMPADNPAIRGDASPERAQPATPLARLIPPPLIDDLTIVNKLSQNLHAELMLRRIGAQQGTGSIADGLVVVRAMMARAGVPRVDYDLSDGSGMSTYNRVTPRGVAIFLRWIAAQPWGTAWRATLPVSGEGTLAGRFGGSALDHKLFAKTGTLNATSALSGYMIAKSGRALVFSAYANDIPDGARVTEAIDNALLMIAAEN